ncbi:MAG: SDR family NAD-dependent epimerase/dehydratase, partial [Mucinivorans sp.]
LNNEDITIYGRGMQTRSFQYVDNLIDGMINFMDTEDDIVGPVNLGNPVEYTILDLALKILALTNSKSKLIYKELPSDDPKQRQPDITLARKLINYNPDIELTEGLEKTIAYFKQNKQYKD